MATAPECGIIGPVSLEQRMPRIFLLLALGLFVGLLPAGASAEDPPIVSVEGQPLAANVRRVLQALELLGAPLSKEDAAALEAAAKDRDSTRLQKLLDKQVLFVVALNPESRVKVLRGPGPTTLQQAGYTPFLVKVINESTVTKRLKIISPQAGAVYGGASLGSLQRQQQTELNDLELKKSSENTKDAAGRFLGIEMFSKPPMTEQLSGLQVEYALAIITSTEAGKRVATIGFDVEQGNQDLGFRGETPVLFTVRPATRVTLKILDDNGRETVGKLLFRDALGHVYPPQAKRLAPDLFFQPHVYRRSGDVVTLPPGELTLVSSRGPEYRSITEKIVVPATGTSTLTVKLQRWVNPVEHGYYCGDHHIHAAGCAHYTIPTEGVLPEDMFLQVKGEGLNVGCVLTWGPCYRYQRQFFAPKPHDLSEPLTLLKYDLEISGFGSQALGHVCLLNLRDQTYPGSDGTEVKGWPTWTTPVLRWCKEQGGVTGYAHSASGLQIDVPAAAQRFLDRWDTSGDKLIGREEAKAALLTEPFEATDFDTSGTLSLEELRMSHERAADSLPNLAIPDMNGVGAMELPVSVSEGVCDFISAMDTRRIQEWNTWYHVLNCGYPLKASGETDFPCMGSRNVGQGRVYVRMGQIDTIDYEQWCQGIAAGRSYVSDGYAHPLEFQVNTTRPGEGDVSLTAPGKVKVTATVAFAVETPLAVAHGGITPAEGKRVVGDTVVLHGPRREEMLVGGERSVEVIVNGQPVASTSIPADGKPHDVSWEVPIAKSSWVALRHFPQFHTNPVNVLVSGKPIRASQHSARWCLEVIDLLWKNREKNIRMEERQAAKEAFERARVRYRQIASESE
jgi:hypothetical protein